MKLSEFIRVHTDALIDIWEQFASGISLPAPLDVAALRDHARGMLLAIADDLDQPQTQFEQEQKGKGRAPPSEKSTEAALHGAARLTDGFGFCDLAAEFRALRASVLQFWTEQRPIETPIDRGDLIRFNEAIDQALAESAASYVVAKETQSRLFNTLLSASPDLNYIFDVDGKFIFANKAFADLYGVSMHDMVGKRFDEVNVEYGGEMLRNLKNVVATKTTHRGEMPCPAECDAPRTYEYLLVPALDQRGNIEAVAGSARDITERKLSEERTKRRATYDFLTNLPNRSLFRDRLDHEVKHSVRTGLPIALLFIDLDGFKEVNDRLGHDVGDRLLQKCAQRIGGCVRGTDTVARLGGDEFTVILSEVTDRAHIDVLAQEILDELIRPFSILQNEIHISGSIGIALMPQDATTSEDLMRYADQAMYAAKGAGRNRFVFFTVDLRDAAWRQSQVIDELRRALPQHELVVYYQPIVGLASGKIVKAEALLRWQHPQDGLMRAAEFIELANETALIGDIDDWVMAEVTRHAHEWSALLGTPFQISINKSYVEMASKVPFKHSNALHAAPGAPSLISVEITEGALLPATPSVRDKLDAFRRAGMELSIDDYGSGYASLTYLKKFGVDYLKIDRPLVHDIMMNEESRFIAETIIMSAHKFGIKVIAEGVETAAQRDWLKAADCDYAQGYYFSEPLPYQEFERTLAKDGFYGAKPDGAVH